MGKSARLQWTHFQLALILTITALPVLLLSVYLYKRSIEAERRLIKLDTEIMAKSLARRVQSFTRNRVIAMKLTAAFYEGSDKVDDQEFITYSQQLQKDYPEFCSFFFWDANGGLRQIYPKAKLDESTRQLQAAGLQSTVKEVLRSKQLRVISITPLVCHADGISILYPVLKNGKPFGVVMGSIPMPIGFNSLFGEEVLTYWGFSIQDSQGRTLYGSPVEETIAYHSAWWDRGKTIPDDMEAEASFPFGEDTWQLSIWPKQTLQNVLHTESPERILLCGGATTVLIICGVSILFWRQRELKEALEITQEAHDVAQASEKRFRDVMERVHLLGLVLDADAHIIFCNDRLLQTSGYTREELIGKDAIELLVPPQERAVFRKLRREVLSGEKQEISGIMNLMTREGKVRQIAWNHVVSRTADGKVERLTSLGDDITERLAHEEAQRQAQKLESLGVLAGGIAHDFNNLLTTIIGHNELALRKSGAYPELKAHLDNVARTARRLADLTSQMLAYSGRGRFEIRAVNLNQVVEEMADLLRISIPKRVDLRYDLLPELPLIEADTTQIEQVLLNLVTNASEAIQNRSGWIALRTNLRQLNEREISGQKLEAGTYIELTVEDNGCGMDAATVNRIFDPFFTTKFTGRGLGLAVLQGIVRGHGGAVSVESSPGSGTIFHVFFPVKHSDLSLSTEADIFPARVAKADSESDHYEGLGSVLLIDDDEGIRQLTSGILEGAGFKVLTAADGEAGLTLFEEHRGEIEVVLLDLTMPGMGGEATFNQLIEIDPKVSVVMTSGYSNMELEGQFRSKTVAGFMHKPFLPQELIETVVRVARNRSRA